MTNKFCSSGTCKFTSTWSGIKNAQCSICKRIDMTNEQVKKAFREKRAEKKALGNDVNKTNNKVVRRTKIVYKEPIDSFRIPKGALQSKDFGKTAERITKHSYAMTFYNEQKKGGIPLSINQRQQFQPTIPLRTDSFIQKANEGDAQRKMYKHQRLDEREERIREREGRNKI